jgi:hypothetical protein
VQGDGVHQPVARHHPAASKRRIHQAPDVARRERARPVLERFERTAGIGCTDQRADGGAGYDHRFQSPLDQSTDDADVRPAAGRAAAEDEA